MKVLITGTNGFIGKVLCKRLLTGGWRVRGTVRDSKHLKKLPAGIEGLQIGDVGPETDWSKALDGVDTVVHLAARVHVMNDTASDPLSAFRWVNVKGTERLAQQAVDTNVRRFIYMSSIKVNGEGTRDKIMGHPGEMRFARHWHEFQGVKRLRGRDQEKNRYQVSGNSGKTEGKSRGLMSDVRGQGSASKQFFSEEDVPEPQGPYAVSKWEAEQVLSKISHKTGLEVVILRPPFVYGPGVKANFLRLLKVVEHGIPLPLASVNNRRSFIYLGNLVDAIITCMKHHRAARQTYLVSDNEDVSTPDLIRRIGSELGRPVRLFHCPTNVLKVAGKLTGKVTDIERLTGSLTVDISKIMHELGWVPPFSMTHGLRETAGWYKKEGRCHESEVAPVKRATLS